MQDSNKSEPQVSILIPNYNKAPYLRDTLNSVLAQTYTSWECIVVDDHSTDQSWAILEEYAKLDARIKVYIRPVNSAKGGNVCRNFALELAKGELVLFLDSDDILATYCLIQRVEQAQNNPGLDFLGFATALFEQVISDAKYLWNIDTEGESDLSRFLRMDALWQTSGCIYRRGFLLNLNALSPSRRFWQDYELHIKALLCSSRYKKFLSLAPDVFIRAGDKGSLSRSTPFSANLGVLLERINFLDEMFLFAMKEGTKLTKEELHSLISFQYYLTVQLWVKHGRLSDFIRKWLECGKRYQIPMSQRINGLFMGSLLKVNNRISLGQLARKIHLGNMPDYFILEKVQIGRHPLNPPFHFEKDQKCS